jgi:erythromycin esterase-like protein
MAGTRSRRRIALNIAVMALESSIYECFAANTATSSTDMLSRSIFAVWATNEVLPLFEYIRDTQRDGSSI